MVGDLEKKIGMPSIAVSSSYFGTIYPERASILNWRFKLTGEALAREERGLQLCVYVCVVVVARG